ncbi:MAG: hypothetical protein LPK92_04755 [Actinomycetes bacterium]|nr:hypothetical protein [Actinomycetes bacterium]
MAELLQTSPLTGNEIQSRIGGDAFQLWRACFSGPEFEQRVVGRRYVRLDRQVDGYARLSPSILREFLTYTVIGIAGDPAIEDRAGELSDHIRTVSRTKLALSRQIARSLGAEFARAGTDEDRYCVVVAGDIVYGMAHDVYRPERSTGSMVHGSDLDLVVIVEDTAASLVHQLDEAIYGRKYQYLKHPAYNEEIDYDVKPFSKLVDQAAFDTFPHMVACKIYDESQLLFGSESLFQRGKEVLRERGVVDRLREMEEGAIRAREERLELLLSADEMPGGDQRFHFYNDDEAPEFE